MAIFGFFGFGGKKIQEGKQTQNKKGSVATKEKRNTSQIEGQNRNQIQKKEIRDKTRQIKKDRYIENNYQDIDEEEVVPSVGVVSIQDRRKPVGGGAVTVVPAVAGAIDIRRGRKANDEEVDKILKFTGGVVTAPGQIYDLTSKQRTVIAALDEGTILVVESSIGTNAVISALLQLKRGDYEFKRAFYVEMDVIRNIYEAHIKRAGGSEYSKDTVHMQRIVIELIRYASERNCSDIHITVKRHDATIRLRSDGVMMMMKQMEAEQAKEMCSAAFNMADASDASYKPFDFQGARITSLKTELPDRVQAIRLQFNPLPDGGRHCVMRLLYKQKQLTHPDVDSLGYDKRHIKEIKRMRNNPQGIVIICGPTGSGKSTTLQVALQALIKEKKDEISVITVEDPPEYEIKGAVQLSVTNAKTDEDRKEAFRQAITATLRSDPDTIMIGEIRDEASAGLAFQAAMTGHQVWASLHANNAVSIIDRLKDQKVESYKLTDNTLLVGLIGQRLVRILCPKCKLSYSDAIACEAIDDEVKEILVDKFGKEIVESNIYVPNLKGCDKCRDGYKGRTVVAETLIPDEEFMEFMRNEKKSEAIKYWLEKLNGMTMVEHAAVKLLLGMIDAQEIRDKVGELESLNKERVLKFLKEYDEIKGK